MLLLRNIKKRMKRVRYYFYETFYDMWLCVGCKLYFIDILLDTQSYVKYELMMNKRVSKRKDFIEMDSDYGK